MSDTEREAFEAWFGPTFLDTPVWEPVRHGYNNHAVHMAWKGWQARARRSTTTEAPPLTDADADALLCRFNACTLEGLRAIVRAIAARAPAPPSVPPLTNGDIDSLAWEIEFEQAREFSRRLLAGPPAPSVPSGE